MSFGSGVIYIVAYALGLSSVLLAIAYIGQRLVQRLRFAADQRSWFKRGWILFILVGIFIMTGLDKRVQACLLESGYVDVNKIEIKLLDLIGK